MAAIAGTLQWTGRFWTAVRKLVLPFPARKRVKPLTFADTRRIQRELYGIEHTPCRCPACRRARSPQEDILVP